MTTIRSGEPVMGAQPVVNDPPMSHRAWLTYLDGWRGLSVLAVLIGHFAPLTFINTGRLGVELFFCLSGRLMAGILFVERYPLPAFVLRRVSRVWPALWVFVTAMTLVAWQSGMAQIPLYHIGGALTFTENYVSIATGHVEVFDHLWSLAVEEWAYLLLALLALIIRRAGMPVVPLLIGLAVLCIANGIVRTIGGGDYYAVYWRTDVRLASILLPCAVFLVLRGRAVWPWLPVVAAVVGVLLHINRVPDPIKYTVGTALLAVAMATIDVAPIWVRNLLSLPLLRRIGLWSFSIYLWQQPFAKAGFATAPVRLILAVLVAIASYYLIENPARRMLNRLIEIRRKRRRPV